MNPLPETGARAPLARRDQAGIELLQQMAFDVVLGVDGDRTAKLIRT